MPYWTSGSGGSRPPPPTAPPRAEIDRAGDLLVAWYEATARSLTGVGEVPEAKAKDTEADERLIGAVERDLSDEVGRRSSTAIRVVWTADHIEAARRLQQGVLGPARAVARLQREHNARVGLFRPS
jgi:hypothetical protein